MTFDPTWYKEGEGLEKNSPSDNAMYIYIYADVSSGVQVLSPRSVSRVGLEDNHIGGEECWESGAKSGFSNMHFAPDSSVRKIQTCSCALFCCSGTGCVWWDPCQQDAAHPCLWRVPTEWYLVHTITWSSLVSHMEIISYMYFTYTYYESMTITIASLTYVCIYNVYRCSDYCTVPSTWCICQSSTWWIPGVTWERHYCSWCKLMTLMYIVWSYGESCSLGRGIYTLYTFSLQVTQR